MFVGYAVARMNLNIWVLILKINDFNTWQYKVILFFLVVKEKCSDTVFLNKGWHALFSWRGLSLFQLVKGPFRFIVSSKYFLYYIILYLIFFLLYSDLSYIVFIFSTVVFPFSGQVVFIFCIGRYCEALNTTVQSPYVRSHQAWPHFAFWSTKWWTDLTYSPTINMLNTMCVN